MAIFSNKSENHRAIHAQELAMIEASELIAEALEFSGMSQSELADALGVSKSEITARLKGERNITVRKLAATLHAMGGKLDLNVSVKKPAARKFLGKGSPIAATYIQKVSMKPHQRSMQRIDELMER